ncbi:hypothetical protein [Lysinibacillus sphaericus]|uniref:hypothetical protein n=1 Tax=Lysinibacillus sphaericus TaxID=1421 RepID=UPI0004DF81AE|nr:hypothetical protein [Lysinibacillus sphaericus]PIJ98632.1 hypothetical protein CTN02_08110 [Lysinibacillus sphaericus]QIC47707.1 hypothetical protein GAG94_11665 [Lysinibacillus sphaericus]QPA58639.1 hypothetical protein INQ55_21805 [Lysinibacillus sphaericus]
MNIKNELEKSIPTSIKLSENDKANIMAKLHQSHSPNYQWKPLMVAILAAFMIGISLIPTIQNTKESLPPSAPSMANPDEQEELQLEDDQTKEPPPALTDEVKKQYYEQYLKIIEEAMALKSGLIISVSPIEKFEADHWITPEEFEKDVYSSIEQHLITERKMNEMMLINPEPVITDNDGSTTKKTYLYFPDLIRTIEVTGEFETQYSASYNRQILSSVQNISTKLIKNQNGDWKQTSFKTDLIDGGRTISIQIEGIFELNNTQFEKRFTIEFSCDEYGKIY